MPHRPDAPIIGAQLDLKGSAWKPAALTGILDDMAGLGINCLLVEYEDLFPFQGLALAEDSRAVWKPRTLTAFLDRAHELGIEIIPLQQCLGHLEYLFRWDRYRHLAQDPAYPSTIRIDHDDALTLLKDMLGQIMDAHPRSRYIHLGMDEAHALKQNPLVEKKGGVLGAFLHHLDALTSFVESRGKTPIIWTDMIEDHYDPKSPLLDLRDRVVFMPWDYASTGQPQPQGRIHGWRQSRDFWKDPMLAGGKPLPEDAVVEGLPAAVRREIAPYYDPETRLFAPMWQVDWLSAKGLRLIGAGAARSTSHGETIPHYQHLMRNLDAWSTAIQRNNQLGVMATSWARGTTFCPPNLVLEMTWPALEHFGRAWGAGKHRFWTGLSASRQERLIGLIGHCQQGWSAHDVVLAEMAEARAAIRSHVWEWDALRLMVETHKFHADVHFAGLEVDWFAAAQRPVDAEWQRRLDYQANRRKLGHDLRRRVQSHFSQRYHGMAYREWLDHLFAVPQAKLDRLTATSRPALAAARKRYR